jgi:hypothetical protein
VERLRTSLKEVTKERDHLAGNCEKYRQDLANEAAFRLEFFIIYLSIFKIDYRYTVCQ